MRPSHTIHCMAFPRAAKNEVIQMNGQPTCTGNSWNFRTATNWSWMLLHNSHRISRFCPCVPTNLSMISSVEALFRIYSVNLIPFYLMGTFFHLFFCCCCCFFYPMPKFNWLHNESNGARACICVCLTNASIQWWLPPKKRCNRWSCHEKNVTIVPIQKSNTSNVWLRFGHLHIDVRTRSMPRASA